MMRGRLNNISGWNVRVSVDETPIKITRPSGLRPLIASAVALYCIYILLSVVVPLLYLCLS